MNIGIIGAGHIGGSLTRRFSALGHKVFVANSRGPETLAALAQETGATPVTVTEAARSGDVVIVTIPEKHIPELPRDLFAGVPDSVVVIDTGNYYPQQRDGRIDGIVEGTTESLWVSQQLGRPVVKAFNNIYAAHLLKKGQPTGIPGRIAVRPSMSSKRGNFFSDAGPNQDFRNPLGVGGLSFAPSPDLSQRERRLNAKRAVVRRPWAGVSSGQHD